MEPRLGSIVAHGAEPTLIGIVVEVDARPLMSILRVAWMNGMRTLIYTSAVQLVAQ